MSSAVEVEPVTVPIELVLDTDAPLECTASPICHNWYPHAAVTRASGRCTCGHTTELWCTGARRRYEKHGVACDTYQHLTRDGSLVVTLRAL